MRSSSIRRVSAGVVLLSVVLSANVSVAQQNSSESATLEEITVTARGWEESLQDTPISETVFNAQQVEDARIDRVEDFIALTPGVTISQAQNAGQSFAMFRGLTQVRNNEAPMAVVIDGVLTAGPNQLTRELFDIESIEVVRGPQGALYGRNATGGAIIINTRAPGDEFEGYVRSGFAEGDEYFVLGGISGALSDNVSASLNAKYLDRGGYYDNVTLGTEADPFEEIAITGKLNWQLSDALSAALKFSYVENDGAALNVWFQPTLLDDQNRFAGFDFASPIVGGDTVFSEFFANNLGINDREIFEASLKLDYDTDVGTFTSITAIQNLDELSAGDQFPYTAAAFADLGFDGLDGSQSQFFNWDAWSQEFRLTSDQGQRLRWMLGAYALFTDRFVSTTAGRDLGQGIVRLERTPRPTDPGNPTLSFLADDNDNTAWAVFANFTYDFTDRLEGYFGLRYDEDDREQSVSPLQFGLPPGVGNPGAVNQRTFSELQPKVSLNYAINDDFRVFGSWGRGFRSGQFNQNGVSALVANATDVADEEVSETTELGFKSTFADGRATLNGSIYQTDVEGQHYFLFVGAVSAQIMVNIDEVEIVGGELELTANLADGFDVYAGIGLIDSEIKEYAFEPTAVGNDAPYVSDSTYNLGAQYRTDVGTSSEFLARVDYSVQGDRFWDPANTTMNSSIEILNARLAMEFGDGKWSVAAYGKNLLDTEYNLDITADGGLVFSFIAPPRVLGFDVRVNF